MKHAIELFSTYIEPGSTAYCTIFTAAKDLLLFHSRGFNQMQVCLLVRSLCSTNVSVWLKSSRSSNAAGTCLLQLWDISDSANLMALSVPQAWHHINTHTHWHQILQDKLTAMQNCWLIMTQYRMSSWCDTLSHVTYYQYIDTCHILS